ncbi:Histidine kinase-, DNA gyrase B-, and HSP90-like ATPase [Dyella jiangningensis]|uniref:ATP-binding protein n=1 Tax=Dyella sp. AtDHG13 TaxID=1938897 RepID=UPI000880F7EE|nr:ATP-binding protein [Dyella sp. AtDHG13]PXV57112.1 histidine kinase/DNA gyrase B/HSP90-like ATPase [Dyella sp. AtDHG13]SDL41210.1 Histidine kinase-, DNA gyrase B-, and HSP90-like ATPase [Dyella jiangningensis]
MDSGKPKTLAERIRDAGTSGAKIEDVLQTDQRVLARITDGIYRQPASALRELIANAYDADASQVVIETDPPRFDRMIIRDDGSGMSVETLAYVLQHIGGSLKRTAQGAKLDVTSSSNASLSPGGRKLIGKIGIGLFSVAQLTPHFQVITKTKGEKTRRIADIILAPEDAERALAERGGDTELKTGTVRIWSVPATDVESHGTEIVLMDLRPQTKELLRSQARWAALRPSPEGAQENWMPTATVEPVFHIGGLDYSTKRTISLPASLPWKSSDSPTQKFKKLVDGVRAQTATNPNPELEQVLDNYLRLIWTLSLALPSRYVDQHPFDLDAKSGLDFFAISNDAKGQASELALQGNAQVRSLMGLSSPADFEDTEFKVLIDGVQLLRPLKFGRAKESTHAMSRDLLFVGKCAPDLSKIPEEYRGGNLSFEAYLYWSPKIVPKDHNGVLVRLKGASGTLFDPTFMGYQVSEQTRLKQLTAEIFVHEGLEGALNIDRESFNYASIHYQFISRWLHGAIRQFANRQKLISGKLLSEKKEKIGQQLDEKLQRAAESAWEDARGENAEAPPEIVFGDDDKQVLERRAAGAPAFTRSAVLKASQKGKGKKLPADLEPRLRAIALVLQAYGVFDNMQYAMQEKLIGEIGRIITTEASDGD